MTTVNDSQSEKIDAFDVLEARVFQLDEICTWLESTGREEAAQALYAERDRFLLRAAKQVADHNDNADPLQDRARPRRRPETAETEIPAAPASDAFGGIRCPHAEVCNGCTSIADVKAQFEALDRAARRSTIEECAQLLERAGRASPNNWDANYARRGAELLREFASDGKSGAER